MALGQEDPLMKGKRYSEEQIIRILKRVESGESIAKVCRAQGVSKQTVYRWRSKYRGMDLAELHRLKELEEENRLSVPKIHPSSKQGLSCGVLP